MVAQTYADACKGLVHDGNQQRSIPGEVIISSVCMETFDPVLFFALFASPPPPPHRQCFAINKSDIVTDI